VKIRIHFTKIAIRKEGKISHLDFKFVRSANLLAHLAEGHEELKSWRSVRRPSGVNLFL